MQYAVVLRFFSSEATLIVCYVAVMYWRKNNGYRKYKDILTGEKLSTILVANTDIIYLSAGLSSSIVGAGVKGVSS